MSDEKVETEHRQLMGFAVIEKTHGSVFGGKREVQRGNLKDGDIIESLHTEGNGPMETE